MGFNEKGHPIYQNLDYTKTREEGMILLAAFNKYPWDVEKSSMTLAKLFELWLERKATKVGAGTLSLMKSSYKHCKAYHMQETIDNCGHGYSTQNGIKVFWRHMDKFGLELDIVTRNYGVLLTSATATETTREPFSEQEIKTMWQRQEQPWVDSVLFLLYTGFRISEMLDLRKENVNLEVGTIMGGTKTKAGKNRVVPIHSKIRHIVEARLKEDGEYLFSYKGNRCGSITYRVFCNYFIFVIVRRGDWSLMASTKMIFKKSYHTDTT